MNLFFEIPEERFSETKLVLEYEDGVFIPIEVLDDEDIIAESNSIATLLDCSIDKD